ncbi:MAG: aminoglycoside phosphotransferase family protein [Eubacteriales bacterium]|nr:aminoglycoside phosphotransferase family protein [Eubacteriales bacterium]
MIYNEIKGIVPHFQFEGSYLRASEIASGNVNNTYRLEYALGNLHKLYTLQHINKYVFKNPMEVVGNIVCVTEHIRNKLVEQNEDPLRRVLELIPSVDNQYVYVDEDGEYWRAYTFIEEADALDIVNHPDQMEEVGRAFGNFQKTLADFDVSRLYETIPNFHNTTKRFYRFVRSLDENLSGRVKEVEDEIEFLFDHRRMMGEIGHLLDTGDLPVRVTHNDTKSNNVLLDSATGKALCVIDLDTVMPGSVLYDYGDAIRFGASTAAEDEEDTGKIGLDMEKTRAFTRGFISETNGFLSDAELIRLPLGIKVLTCELAMRFLADYIDGDLYFKVNSPTHNLIRARAQMALLRDVERREGELQKMTEDYIKNLR